MTLSARVTVGPPPIVRRLEAASIAGGAAAVLATTVARIAAAGAIGTDGIALAMAAVLAVFAGRRAWHRPRAGSTVLAIDASVEVAIDDGLARVQASSTSWPGFAVLCFGRTRDPICIVERKLDPRDAWHLRRWLTWLARGGARPDSPDDRSSP